MLLKIRGLQAFIGQFHILQGVDLDVQEGEIVVLLGRNGSGENDNTPLHYGTRSFFRDRVCR